MIGITGCGFIVVPLELPDLNDDTMDIFTAAQNLITVDTFTLDSEAAFSGFIDIDFEDMFMDLSWIGALSMMTHSYNVGRIPDTIFTFPAVIC